MVFALMKLNHCIPRQFARLKKEARWRSILNPIALCSSGDISDAFPK
jgi:hypothetical protein